MLLYLLMIVISISLLSYHNQDSKIFKTFHTRNQMCFSRWFCKKSALKRERRKKEEKKSVLTIDRYAFEHHQEKVHFAIDLVKLC